MGQIIPRGASPMFATWPRPSGRLIFAVLASLLGVLPVTAQSAAPIASVAADRTTPRPPRPVAPRSNVLTPEPWKGTSFEPLTAAELDRRIDAELQAGKLAPSPRTTDEVFLRRVSLDLTGTLPTPQEVLA